MGLAVRLVTPALRVTPGAEVGTEVRIRNTGHLVDQVDLAVLGDGAAWATVEPVRLNLLPGQEETVHVTFAPPRLHDVTAGQQPYAVRAASREDPDGSTVEEGTLTVGEFELVVAEMVPRASRAPRAGRHELAVDNLSNHPLTLQVSASDPDAALDFRLNATEFVAQPGTATFVKLRARPTTRFLRGTERQLPFEVAVSAGGAPQVVAPGTVRQHAILPAWLFRLAVILALLAALWVVLLKPKLDAKLQDVAQAEAVKATAPLAPKVSELVQQDTAAKEAAAAAAANPTAGPTPAGSPTPTPTPTASPKPKPKPTPTPTPAPVPPAPVPTPTPAPTPAPPPRRTTNFSKVGWVEAGQEQYLGPAMPTRPETLVHVTQIVVHNPYSDYGTLTFNRIRAGQAQTAVVGGAPKSEVGVDQPAYYDAAAPLRVKARCSEPSGFNPGPPEPHGETRYCFFVVVVSGYTEAPKPKPWPAQTPSPTPSPSPTPPPQVGAIDRRMDL